MNAPKRGNCGTCHWFEPNPDPSQAGTGLCYVTPPVPAQTMVSAGLGPQGPMMKPALQGLSPPTHENRRCAQWRPAGMLPDLALEFSRAS